MQSPNIQRSSIKIFSLISKVATCTFPRAIREGVAIKITIKLHHCLNNLLPEKNAKIDVVVCYHFEVRHQHIFVRRLRNTSDKIFVEKLVKVKKRSLKHYTVKSKSPRDNISRRHVEIFLQNK